MKVLVGFMAKLPADRVDALAHVPGRRQRRAGHRRRLRPGVVRPREDLQLAVLGCPGNRHADDEWKDGYTGAGVDVAVIDSGVADLPQFAGHVVNGPDLSFGSGDAADGVDLFGHGTHIAGIIAGSRSASARRLRGPK